jgi:hypothetical protein
MSHQEIVFDFINRLIKHEIVGEKVEIKIRAYKIEDNTWARGDMKFIFECSS